MKNIFISDDRFFILGAKENNNSLLKDTVFINANNELHTLEVSSGDVVILKVKNDLIRKKIMRMPAIKMCRLLILPYVPISSSARKTFPWLLRMNLSFKGLWDAIGQAEKEPIIYDHTTELNISVFNRLGEGMSVPLIASCEKLTEQHVYRIKRNTAIRYGLNDCNNISVLFCRDILNISKNISR